MKLRIRDMEAENQSQSDLDYLDLFEIGVDPGEDEDNPIIQWIKPAHLDDTDGNPDPRVAMHASQLGVNVENVIAEEVVSSDNDGNDSFEILLRSKSSATQFTPTSRTSGSSYVQLNQDEDDDDGHDGGGDRERDDNNDDDDDDDGGYGGGGHYGGGDGGGSGTYYQGKYYPESSQQPLSPFTGEDRYTHATQDVDHGSRAADIGFGATSSRQHNTNELMTDNMEDYITNSFDTMSISTQPRSPFGNADNVRASQISHTESDGFYSNYGVDVFGYPMSPLPYLTPQWVNPHYPLFGQLAQIDRDTYFWHISNYIENYSTIMSWNAYCYDQQACGYSIHFEQPRSSFWY